MKRVHSNGFTIVELIIVVAVIGILAAVVIVAYNGIQGSARDNAVLSDAQGVEAEVARFATANAGRYYVDASNNVTWYSQGTANANVSFSPSSGNIIDVVSTTNDYCIRVYNPASSTYKSLDSAATKGSSGSSCATLVASDEAVDDAETFTFAAITWTQRTSAGLRAWSAVASSSTGVKLAAAVNGGYIYTSSDSGATWTERTSAGSRAWYSIASSADGTKLAATVEGGYIYTSADSGATWTARTAAGSRQWWGKIASSADGTKLIAAPSFGTPWMSSDSGATWTNISATGSNNWRDFAMSADGNTILGVASSNPVWVSTNGGTSWSSQTVSTVQWYNAAMSSDGTKMAIAPTGNQGPVHTSTNSGTTWTSQPGSTSDCFNGLSSSADGTKLSAATGTCGNGYIRQSLDSGVTWVQNQTMGRAHWTDIAASSNGAKLVIGANQRYTGSFVADGYIYTGLYN
jgi:prepilin-type N-terminal cleavage/methylation domain-containing protein